MADSDAANGVRIQLQSNDTRNLLDTVDNLRSQGINRYVHLPEIAVCGEQSSGKSSVLEAISGGLAFPSKDNLCTRFATELILRRGPTEPVKISIVPNGEEERSESEKEKLRNFNFSISAENLQLGEIIESAKEAMGINDSTKVFSSDILRLEMSGPDQPHLTLVDLPGLFHASSRSQSDADSDTVKALVLKYMRSPRTIILAVVSAKNDFNNQSITRYSREIDPKGLRTLGLITKPDTLDEGSDSERFYVELAQNKEVRFRLGWHVLRNRDFSTKTFSLQERNRAEEQFFASGVWRSLHPSQVGVHSLKPRLSKILKDQIIAQLPEVLAQIQEGIRDCRTKLEVIGPSRATVSEQRRHLLQISHSFSSLIKATADGTYSDSFFGYASSAEGYQKRLRATIQNILADFAETMRKDGHTFHIVDKGAAEHPRHIYRKDYIEKVKNLLQRSRGRELPGTFNPLIIGELFQEQREPWARLVEEVTAKAFSAVYNVVRVVLAHVSDRLTLEGVSKQLIYPKMEGLTTELRSKVDELLEPHTTTHPITYNHYLTENVQRAQSERATREIRNSLQQFLGADYTGQGNVRLNINVNDLVGVLARKTEADMNIFASLNVTDFMEAYYKVALKKFIDDFSVLAVEECLLKKVPSLFCPADVLEMTDAMVTALAAEDEESAVERTRCNEKLTVLENGLRELKGVQGYSSVPFRQIDSLQDPYSEGAGSDSGRSGRHTPSMDAIDSDQSSSRVGETEVELASKDASLEAISTPTPEVVPLPEPAAPATEAPNIDDSWPSSYPIQGKPKKKKSGW